MINLNLKKILDKKVVFAGLFLVVLVASGLVLSDYRTMLDMNPDKAAILIDYQQNNRLELITRGYNWNLNKEVLRWRYDNDGFTLYSNNIVIAKSSWSVYKGSKIETRNLNDININWSDNTNIFSIFKETGYINGHKLTETQVFTQKVTIENFPKTYGISFVPVDNNNYKLVWKVSNLKLKSGMSLGSISKNVCKLYFENNVEVSWCMSKDKVSSVQLGSNWLKVNFKATSGSQNIDVSLTDPSYVWKSSVPADYNTGSGFDFNWTKVTWDGNIMPVGDDRIHNDQNQAFYDPNLVGYWKFNDVNSTGNNARDDTNNNNNGQLINGADINAWGLWDTNALWGDGVNNFVNINGVIDDIQTGTGTWSVWLYLKNVVTKQKFLSIADNDASSYIGYEVYSDGTLRAKATLAGVNKWYVQTNGAYATSRWYHIVLVQTGTTPIIYVNGVAPAQTVTVTTDQTWWANDTGYDNARIGTYAPAGVQDNYFNGFIDEVKIYDRALSAAEIQADYNSWMHSNYFSPVKDAGEAANWDAMDWNAFVDVNNAVTVDYRGCSTADCSTAGAWQTNLRGNPPGTWESNIYADNNRYFQYRVNFDTNRQKWNTVRSVAVADGDKGRFGHFSNVVVTYSDAGEVDTNFSIWDGSTWSDANLSFMSFRCTKNQQNCAPQDQTSTHPIYTIDNNGSIDGATAQMKLQTALTNIVLKCSNVNDSATATSLTTSYQTIYSGTIGYSYSAKDNNVWMWCWADFSNPPAGQIAAIDARIA